MNLINKTIFILIIIMLLTSCEKNPYTKYVASDYFSIKPNTTYEYKVLSDESKNFNIFNTYIKEDIIQQTIFNVNGDVVNKLYKVQEKDISLFYEYNSSYLLDDITFTEQTYNTTIIKMPFKLNKKWTAKNNMTYEITGLEVDITVPYGTFKAIELKGVTVIKNNDDKETAHVIKEYYTKDIGLIKREEILEDGTILSSELSNIKKDSPYEINANFFYTKDNKQLELVPKKIVFNTNDNIPEIIKTAFTDKNILGEQTIINKLDIVNKFDSNGKILDNYIDIDLSKDYIDFINKNADKEILLLKSLVNTLCSNKNSNKVKLTINNDLYKSNNRELIKDEFLSSDFKKDK